MSFSCCRSRSTNFDAVLGENGARLLSWMRETPVSVPAPGVVGAILTEGAFRKRTRNMYAIVLRIVATHDRSRSEGGRGAP